MPSRIVIEHLAGARAGQRQELDPATFERVRFGRHPDNEVAFDAHHDLDASLRHAELRHEPGGGWALVDVGSSNGTIVAGQRITRLAVAEGTPIEVAFGPDGPCVRLYVGDPAALPDVLPPPTRTRTPVAAPARRGQAIALVAVSALVAAALAWLLR